MKKSKRQRFLLLVIIFLLFAGGYSPAEPGFGIIFSAELDGNQDIYRIYGQNFETIERLTFTPIDPEGAITPTKKGQLILFMVPSPGIKRIQAESLVPPATYAHSYLLDTKTKELMELGDNLGLYPSYPQTWVVNEEGFLLTEISSHKIYLVEINNMKAQEYQVPHELNVDYLSYSYDGKQIAYDEMRYAQAPPAPIVRPYFYDIQTKTVYPLIEDELTDCDKPKWSPTRKQILIFCTSSEDNGFSQVRLLNINLSKTNNIVEEVAVYPDCFNPEWSPDGEDFIMVCRDDEEKERIFLANYDGVNSREILANIHFDYVVSFHWSPDGEQLIYTAPDPNTSSDESYIYIVNIDGTNNNAITQEPANYGQLFVYPIEP